jgi:hypothetical protein
LERRRPLGGDDRADAGLVEQSAAPALLLNVS